MSTLSTVFSAVRTHERLTAIARSIGIDLEPEGTLQSRSELFVSLPGFQAQRALRRLTREELRAAVKRLDIDVTSNSRDVYIDAILEAAGGHDALVQEEAAKLRKLYDERVKKGGIPEAGDEVRLRQGNWLVKNVTEGGVLSDGRKELTMVDVVGLDDDRQGQELQVLWELELGARVVPKTAQGFESITDFDEPNLFGAWLDAIRWQGVTAKDAAIFQAPFRAGVKLYHHQLVPLQRALELPRANLFIADDVGLGKTIEAGFVIQELRLRQQVDNVLIVAPPAVCVQWQEEMRDRFGIPFVIYNRDYIARVRKERGFRINPFHTHTHFIISYHLLRRPEHRERLFSALGTRKERSLLVLDEAHTAAPATSSSYAVDSDTTKTIRALTPKFENRLFLSATPHNGHSNSFSALLEMLDPQRFNRGVPIEGKAKEELNKVMVRRLKSDLREHVAQFSFPYRRIVPTNLWHENGAWYGDFEGNSVKLAESQPTELILAEKLKVYADEARKLGASPMIFSHLQQRLLSSVAAFESTFRVHMASAKIREQKIAEENKQLKIRLEKLDESNEQWDKEREEIDAINMERLTTHMSDSKHLTQMREEIYKLAERNKNKPDVKTQYILEWIRQNMCAGAGKEGRLSPQERAWNPRRLIIFTEYTTTIDAIYEQLSAAFENTDLGNQRIQIIDGATNQDDREEIKRAFNGDPSEYPVRILLATDAAREGINLQASCYDLFHYDLPWNPARIEQRNGRIDRQMQPNPEVFCRHFHYTQRTEDRILNTLIRKMETIQNELGSLGQILFSDVEELLKQGIDPNVEEAIEALAANQPKIEKIKRELDAEQARIKKEISNAGGNFERSLQYAGISPDRLREVINTALIRLNFAPLEPTKVDIGSQNKSIFIDAWKLPTTFGNAWQNVLNTIREPLPIGEPAYKLRDQELRPVVFEAPNTLTSKVVHLHLEHPLVKRLLESFRSSGFAPSQLQRVTILRTDVARPTLNIYGRLSLFGEGAKRLHDEVIAVARTFDENDATFIGSDFKSLSRKEQDTISSRIRKTDSHDIAGPLRNKLAKALPRLIQEAWQRLEVEADNKRTAVEGELEIRGQREASALTEILKNQQIAIQFQLEKQLDVFSELTLDQERRQLEADRKFMQRRMDSIDNEINTEPEALREMYTSVFHRVQPVGAVILWPEAR